MFKSNGLAKLSIISTLIYFSGIGAINAESFKQQDLSDSQAMRRGIANTGWPSVMIGVSTEQIKEEDVQAMISDILPFTNDISKQTRSVFTVIPNRDDRIFNDDIKNRRYKYVFCELRDCFSAISSGYIPIAKREDMQRAIMLTRASENIKKEDQIPRNAKIGFYGDGVLRVMASAFKSSAGKSLIDLNGFSRASVSSQMFDGKIDAMVVSSNDINAITGNHPAQFGMASRSEAVPNAILLARPDIHENEYSKVVDAFINVNTNSISQMFLTPDMSPGLSTFQTLNKSEKDTIYFVYKRSASIKKIDSRNNPSNAKQVGF